MLLNNKQMKILNSMNTLKKWKSFLKEYMETLSDDDYITTFSQNDYIVISKDRKTINGVKFKFKDIGFYDYKKIFTAICDFEDKLKIDWDINYLAKTATCSNLTVSIIKVKYKQPLAQKIEDCTVSLGFEKDGIRYFCLITDINSILWKQNLEDNKLLPNYMSQLREMFNNNSF